MSQNITQNPNDLSFDDFISKLIFWFKYLKQKTFVIISIGIVGGISGFFFATFQSANYSAKITFVLEEGKNSSSSLGSLASLAGQFGVDVASGSDGGILSGENILLYFKSPSLAREVLLTKFDSLSPQTIADKYALVYKLNLKWSKNSDIKFQNFHVVTNSKMEERAKDSLLQIIVDDILEKRFFVTKADKKASFIDVIARMENESLAKIYCERIVQRVVDRYINLKTQRQISTVEKLQKRVDSVASLLRQKTITGASLQNMTSVMDINPIFKTETSVNVETTLRDKALLSSIFASVTQNLEIAKFTLSQETPVIQIIDSPILPLKVDKISKFKSSVYTFCFFVLLSIIFLIVKKITLISYRV